MGRAAAVPAPVAGCRSPSRSSGSAMMSAPVSAPSVT